MFKTKEEFELIEQINVLRGRLDDIETARANQKYGPVLGLCFRNSNSYISGDSWPMYARVVKVDRWPYCFRFQTDQSGKVTIEPRELISNLDGWTRIEPAEFGQKWHECLAALTATQQGQPITRGALLGMRGMDVVESATRLLARIDSLTTEQFSRDWEREEREALRAALSRFETARIAA